MIFLARTALLLGLTITSGELLGQTERTVTGRSGVTWQSSSRLPRPQRTVYASAASGMLGQEEVVGEPTPDPTADTSIMSEGSEIIASDSDVIYDGNEVIVDGSTFEEGVTLGEGEYIVGDEHGHGDVGGIYEPYGGQPYCDDCHTPGRVCLCLPAHGWFQADYLLWYQAGMEVPPLVTTSTVGTARTNAGVLGLGSTTTLIGDEDLLTDEMSGGRLRFGWWLSRFPGWGLEGEYVGAGSITETQMFQSTGSPILARPFFNMLSAEEDAQLVAFPNVLTGAVTVAASSEFSGAAFRLRRQLCASEGCGTSWWNCQPVPVASNTDLTLGYRFFELDESLSVNENLTSLVTNEPGAFNITDRFSTRNQFNGPELGVQWRGRKGYWSLDLLMRLSLGNNHQTVNINGTSAVTENGTTTNYNGGMLAQRTNIGSYERDRFAVVPELGATVGYQLTRGWKLNVGYSFIYWSSVVRPGDQIDLDVNPNLLPPEEVPFSGALRPEFRFVESDYWIQGLSLGAEYRW
jgi:hypothetical protein